MYVAFFILRVNWELFCFEFSILNFLVQCDRNNLRGGMCEWALLCGFSKKEKEVPFFYQAISKMLGEINDFL